MMLGVLSALLLAVAPPSLLADPDFRSGAGTSWTASGQGLAFTPLTKGPGTYPTALRATYAMAEGMNPWNLQLGQPVAAPFKKGDHVYIQVWLRSPDRSAVGVVFERGREPYDKMLFELVRPPKEWKEYRFLVKASDDFPASGTQFKFFFGYGKGTVDIGHATLRNYGPTLTEKLTEVRDYYGGQVLDDKWKVAANQRIEKIRKGDITIQVRDGKGKAIPNAKVSVEMTKHAFRWGTAVVGSRILGNTEDDKRYRQVLTRLFNAAVFENDMKWADWAVPNLPETDIALDWLRTQGFAVRGHNLVWGSQGYLPDSVKNLDADGQRAAVTKHISDYVNRFKGRLYAWDVVNEAVSERWLWDRIGWDQYIEAHRLTKQIDPSTQIVVNDFNLSNVAQVGAGHTAGVIGLVKRLQEANVVVDYVGDQAHFGTPLTPIPDVLKVWDRLTSETKARLEVTEFDLTVGDDAIHAKYIGDFLTAAFSHPKMDSVLFWGFWEGNHWRGAEAALFRRDWTPRAAAKTYEDLVLNKWRTRASLTGDANGIAKVRGFYGDYRVTVTLGGKKFTRTMRHRAGTPSKWQFWIR